MDSERRHELETNDLREFLDNFKDFWDKHGNKLLITLIIVLGGFAGYNYYNQWKDGKAEDAYNALSGATTVGQLLAVAEEHPMVHDEAMRRAGDLALNDARLAEIEGRQDAVKKSIKQSSSAYTAIATRGKTVPYQIAGNEGLAIVAIMSGEWDKARTHYNKIIDLAGEDHPAQAARAENGLERIDLLKDPVAFAPEDDLSFDPKDDPVDRTSDDIDDAPDQPGSTGDSLVPDINVEDLLNPSGASPAGE